MDIGLMVRECNATEYSAALSKLTDMRTPAPLTQSPLYGAWQTRDGKVVVYYTAHSNKRLVAAGLGVQYNAPGGISFLYCPYGPVAKQWTPELLRALHDFFGPIAKRTGTAFVRLDADGLTTNADAKPVTNRLAATASLQPRSEWLLAITAEQDNIWMSMHKHARYNVRLAERAHAKLELFAPAEAPLDTFLSLMQTTAGRDSFGLHRRQYYEAVLQSVPADNGFVILCTISDQPAAVALFAAYDGVVHYIFAGSSNDFRKIAPPYFIIWNAILEAKRRSWHTLNFGGISDNVKGTQLAGVTGFKKRFDGYEVSHPNPVDLIYNHFKYAAFSLYKHLR